MTKAATLIDSYVESFSDDDKETLAYVADNLVAAETVRSMIPTRGEHMDLDPHSVLKDIAGAIKELKGIKDAAGHIKDLNSVKVKLKTAIKGFYDAEKNLRRAMLEVGKVSDRIAADSDDD